ncbi:Protein THEM6, partial [Gryllus bimaculatus]
MSDEAVSSWTPTMLVLCYVLGGLLITLLALYVTLELHYFLRMCLCVLMARFCKPRISILDDTYVHGLCTTQDVDIFWRHMNNARYVRELDFARFDYYDRSGLYQEIVKLKGNAMQGASNQQFVTPRDGFVRTIAMSKQNIVGVDVPSLMRRVVGERPEQPPELMHWLRSVELSSARLRRSD